MEAIRHSGSADEFRSANIRLVVPPDPRYGKYVRERVADFAHAAGIPDADVRDLLAALGEALANAVEHGKSDEKIEVRCWITADDAIVATVIDRGVGIADPDRLASEPTLPDTFSERGRGLAIMRKFSDDVSIRSSRGKGTVVTLTRYVRPQRMHVVAGN